MNDAEPDAIEIMVRWYRAPLPHTIDRTDLRQVMGYLVERLNECGFRIVRKDAWEEMLNNNQAG